jgi:hypothetical protein
MHYSLAEMGEIRRLRAQLIWALVMMLFAATLTAFLTLGELFRGGSSERVGEVFGNLYIAASYLWVVYTSYRLARALDPRFYYYWSITALLLLPVVNLIALASLFLNSAEVLAGPKGFR